MAWFGDLIKKIDDKLNPSRKIRKRRPSKRSELLVSQRDPSMITTHTESGEIVVKARPDAFFLITYALLLVLGTILSFSAGSAYAQEEYSSGFYFVTNHLKHLLVGGVVSAVIYFLSRPRNMKLFSIAFYGGSILLLIAVLIVGRTGGGAQRWLDFGLFTIQPSELAKTAIILLIALYLTQNEEAVRSKNNLHSFFHGFLIPTLIFGLVCILVIFERHFSGVIIIAAIGIGMLFLGGMKFRWFTLYLVPAAAVVLAIINTDYAMDRVQSWLNKDAGALTDNWQSTQGLYAISSGGLFGVGLGESRLKYGYVSQPQNDFVFTIVCEELGFVGATAILILFAVLVARGVVVGLHAPDKFTSLVIFGITFKLALHVILNVGVVSGILPNTGISLPFFSSGGSATITQMIDMALVLGLSRFCTQKA